VFFENTFTFFALDADVCAWAEEICLVVEGLIEDFSKHDFGEYS
jgi:hypothetical protein